MVNHLWLIAVQRGKPSDESIRAVVNILPLKRVALIFQLPQEFTGVAVTL
jgi:hypothetical protein